MPNWLYLGVHFLYHAGLAIWIGGAIALGALVAPALFRDLPRAQAGRIFGPTLRRFARLRVAAISVTVLAAATQLVVFERRAATAWIAIRWIALTLMAAIVLYEILVLERAMERSRMSFPDDAPDDDPRRNEFRRLHGRAEGLMKAGTIAAMVAVLFS